MTNSGSRSWDSTRVHFSYHWLWVVPRETTSRSRWDVPYHDGIRTDLGVPVTPGKSVALQGRLAPPSWPGLYWLQWDMVEEGVTWFAQVSPRQPRTLVLVLPPLAWVLAPLPLVVAIWGVIAVGRRQLPQTLAPRATPGLTMTVTHPARIADVADLIWCAASLGLKPLVVAYEALLEPTAVASWLTLVTATVVPLLALLLLPRRIRAWTLVAVGIVGSLTVVGDVVYYRFFGDVLSAPAILAAPQTPRVWGSIRGLFSPILVWLVIDWPFAIWLAVRFTQGHGSDVPWRTRVQTVAGAVATLVVVGFAVSARLVLASTRLDQMFRNRAVVEELGLFGYHAYDGWNYARSTWLRAPVTEADTRDALDWFEERASARGGSASPAYGVARGFNLLVIQVESLQDFVVNYRVEGQEVMPHLRRWVRDGLRFTNVTDQTSEGRTSDAEFASLTSLLPLDHGAVAFRFPGNHYTALPGVLVEEGYTTLSAVAFEAGFWNRQVMHPAYGFQQTLFEADFKLTDQIGWGLNDHDFLQQMVARLEQLPHPFAAWLITLSLHHPFEDFPDRHKTLKLGALEGTSFGNYLHAMRFFDQALEDFRLALARDGLLQRSVVVVFGDHDAGFAREASLSQTIGIGGDEVAWTLNDRVPFFVRIPESIGAVDLRGARDVPAGQTDFAPTLLNVLGVDAAALPYMGRNLLGAPGGGPVPRPYGDWLDAHHLFLAHGVTPRCYTFDGRTAAPGECGDGDRAARREHAVSRMVVEGDLQERLRTRMADTVR